MAQTAQAVALFHDKKGRAKDYPVALLPLIDTHGHLTDFDENTPTRALARAAQAGVCHLVSPVDPTDDATDPRHLMYAFHMWCKDAHTLIDAQRQAGVSFPKFEGQEAHGRTADAAEIAHFVRIVAGVHPYGAKAYLEDPEVKKHLIFILRCPVCVGVGEIGLDYTCGVDHEEQKRAFIEQLDTAQDWGLPVELHIRDARADSTAEAHRDALKILKQVGIPKAGCDLHCFTSTPDVLHDFVAIGCSVAFGGALTFKSSDEIRDAALVCPQHALLSETDCPYMAPVPLRGMEAEPAMVAYVTAALAQLRLEHGEADSLNQTYQALWDNGNALFFSNASKLDLSDQDAWYPCLTS
ncbi:MAG: TatD family hydrolase [Coriobacteriaceae bacterium]